MPRDDGWSAEWCCEKLLSHTNILQVDAITGNSVRLTVKNMHEPVSVATMSAHRVKLNTVPEEFHDDDTEFLLNVPKSAFYSGELLEVASDASVGVGGVGDLYTAAGERDFQNYIPKEVRFILQGLRQHAAVRSISRINNRTYLIRKHSGHSVRVLALNEYDLTREALRNGIDTFGLPDFVLASNPNCRLSSAARDVARESGTGVLAWRQLLGVLNN